MNRINKLIKLKHEIDKRLGLSLQKYRIDPTLFTLINGTDAVVDDLWAYQHVNKFKNHWYGPTAPTDPQLGMIWIDSDDGRAYRYYGAAWGLIGMADIKVGSFTRDLTAASGDVAYTGVGFPPKAIIFFGQALDYYESMGFSDGTSHMSRYHDLDSIYAIFRIDTSYCIHAGSPTVYQVAIVKTFNVDGFTLTYTKVGSPTGTLTVVYLAIG